MNKLVVSIALLVMLIIGVYFYFLKIRPLNEVTNENKVESLEGLSEELDSLLNKQGN